MNGRSSGRSEDRQVALIWVKQCSSGALRGAKEIPALCSTSPRSPWMTEYNEARPHQGRWCFGKTPLQTFLDTMPMMNEKMIAA